MKPYIVSDGKKYLGRVLGLSKADALTRASKCWPAAKSIKVKLVEQEKK